MPDQRTGRPGRGGDDDRSLVRSVIAGDSGSFEPLAQRYSDTLVRFAYHMIGDFQTAEDIAQESLLKAFSHIGRLEEAEKFATWLYSIARHLCLDHIRAKRSSVSVEVLEQEGVEVSDSESPEPGDPVQTVELHGQVLRELAGLRSDYREILLLKHAYELSYREIGEMVGLSVSAVGEKLSRVREMLRKRLRRARSGLTRGPETEG